MNRGVAEQRVLPVHDRQQGASGLPKPRWDDLRCRGEQPSITPLAQAALEDRHSQTPARERPRAVSQTQKLQHAAGAALLIGKIRVVKGHRLQRSRTGIEKDRAGNIRHTAIIHGRKLHREHPAQPAPSKTVRGDEFVRRERFERWSGIGGGPIVLVVDVSNSTKRVCRPGRPRSHSMCADTVNPRGRQSTTRHVKGPFILRNDRIILCALCTQCRTRHGSLHLKEGFQCRGRASFAAATTGASDDLHRVQHHSDRREDDRHVIVAIYGREELADDR